MCDQDFTGKNFYKVKEIASMVDDKIIKDIKIFVNQISSEFVIDSVYLFGSYAEGKFTEFSDIDIAIVSNSFIGFALADNEKILASTKNINRMIEPHPFRTEEFTVDNPSVKEIVATGIRII